MCSASQQDGQSYRSQMPESLRRRRAQRMGEASWERTGFTNPRTIWKQAVGGAGKRRGGKIWDPGVQVVHGLMCTFRALTAEAKRLMGVTIVWVRMGAEGGLEELLLILSITKAGMLAHELYHTWLKVSATGAKTRALQPSTQGLRSNWSLNDEMEMNAL